LGILRFYGFLSSEGLLSALWAGANKAADKGGLWRRVWRVDILECGKHLHGVSICQRI